MKRKNQLACLLAVLSFTLSCTSEGRKNKDPKETKKEIREKNRYSGQTLCFESISGKNRRDTSKVQLEIQDNRVKGTYAWLPYQKDRRKGSILGIVSGDVIKGTWTFMQEGMTDSLPVEFRLNGNKLYQKDYSADPGSGRQFLSDTSKFSIEYSASPCR